MDNVDLLHELQLIRDQIDKLISIKKTDTRFFVEDYNHFRNLNIIKTALVDGITELQQSINSKFICNR